MMKFIQLFTLLISFPLLAQVGINTNAPEGIFNIDGKGDNLQLQKSMDSQLNDFVVTEGGSVGIGTHSPQTKLEIESGVKDQSGLRFSKMNKNSSSGKGKAIGVNSTGDVIAVERNQTVFIGRVKPNSVIGPGYQFVPLEVVYDPENKYNESTYRYGLGDEDRGVYQIEVSLHTMESSRPFTHFRPNSATIIPLPTDSGQYFHYHYSGLRTKGGDMPSIQSAELGIKLYNRTGADYTFSDTLTFVNRGYWTITIKRLTTMN